MGVVDPGPAIADHMGQLIVYTATDEFQDGDDTWAYPHTSYFIYRPDGSRYEYVANHISRSDSQPDTVDLTSGQYYIVAEADFAPRVRMPVNILTRPYDHCESRAWNRGSRASRREAEVNYLRTDGTVIGWNTAG
jgi:hypothetical protein